jgi:hypothetical protein
MVLEKIFLIGQSQTRNVYVGHISCTIGSKNGYFVHDLSYIIPTKNQFPEEKWVFFNFRQSDIRIAWQPCFCPN